LNKPVRHDVAMTLTESLPRTLTRRRIVTIAVVAVLVGALGWGYWVWTHPTLFDDAGGEVSFAPLATGSTVSGGVAYGPGQPSSDETITLHSAKAHFASTSAKAIVTFAVCVSIGNLELSSSLPNESLTKYCREVRPLKDGTKFHIYRDDPAREYVMMTMRSTGPGRVHIDAVTFDYSRSGAHFHQHGSDTSKQDWTIRAAD
jgi:hypothetical protein